MPQNTQPNILLILADDHGWNDLGCYGNPVVQTPNLDRMAADGVRFQRCFTTAPLCSPGRGAVMTGLYPHVSGVKQLVQGSEADQLSLSPSIWTLGQGLLDIGYETAASSKWHLSTAGATAHGFEFEFPQRDTYLAQSVEFLKRDHDRPWFMYFCPTHTHRRFRRQPQFPYSANEVANALPPYLKDTPQVREDYALYLSETSQMDWEIGQLLSEIDSSRSMDNTIVAYCTDHGPSMHRAKFSLYDWGTHSSLIFRGPGIVGSGRVDTGLASTIDIAPTLMNLAGKSAPATCQGRNLSDRLAGKGNSGWEYVYTQHHEGNEMRAVRSEHFKLIHNVTTHEPLLWPQVIDNWQGVTEDTLRHPYPLPRPTEEFYDLETDPLETENLINNPQFQEQINNHRVELDRWWNAG